jgi:diketogulonate reductase-like aldo/keto reductase
MISYSPLANGPAKLRAALRAGALEEVAEATGKTEAQVALNWCISKLNVIAIPKSDSAERSQENCNASGWRLSEDHVRLLESAMMQREFGHEDGPSHWRDWTISQQLARRCA